MSQKQAQPELFKDLHLLNFLQPEQYHHLTLLLIYLSEFYIQHVFTILKNNLTFFLKLIIIMYIKSFFNIFFFKLKYLI